MASRVQSLPLYRLFQNVLFTDTSRELANFGSAEKVWNDDIQQVVEEGFVWHCKPPDCMSAAHDMTMSGLEMMWQVIQQWRNDGCHRSLVTSLQSVNEPGQMCAPAHAVQHQDPSHSWPSRTHCRCTNTHTPQSSQQMKAWPV